MVEKFSANIFCSTVCVSRFSLSISIIFLVPEEKNTLLHLITKTKNIRMLNFILLLNGNVNATNLDGETPIFNAVRYNNLNIVIYYEATRMY